MEYKVTSFDLKLALLQYYRHHQYVCVSEFRGADIIVDTGKEVIEVEIKTTKSDLISGEKKKTRKHQSYKDIKILNRNRPNKFLFCVPEKLVNIALDWASELNKNYGVIGFDAEGLERHIQNNWPIYWQYSNYFLRIAKSAKKLHENYSDKLRWAIALRTSASIATLTLGKFRKRANLK